MFKRCSILQEAAARTSGASTATMLQARRFRSPEDAARYYLEVQRELLIRCEPYVRIMMDLRSMQAVRYQVQEAGGLVEVDVMWREKDKQMYDQCQEMIDYMRTQYQLKEGEL